jgi:hypothetical protein
MGESNGDVAVAAVVMERSESALLRPAFIGDFQQRPSDDVARGCRLADVGVVLVVLRVLILRDGLFHHLGRTGLGARGSSSSAASCWIESRPKSSLLMSDADWSQELSLAFCLPFDCEVDVSIVLSSMSSMLDG